MWDFNKCFQILNFILPNANLYEKLARKFDKPLINALKIEDFKVAKFLIADKPEGEEI